MFIKICQRLYNHSDFNLTFFWIQLETSAAEEDAEETDVEAEEPERTCKKYLYNLVQGFLNGALSCLGGKFQMKSIFEIGTRFYVSFHSSSRVSGNYPLKSDWLLHNFVPVLIQMCSERSGRGK